MADSEEDIRTTLEELYEALLIQRALEKNPLVNQDLVQKEIERIQEKINELEEILLLDDARISAQKTDIPGVFPLNLDLCGVPKPPPEPEPECPPLCIPDPCASVNWIGSPNEEPFLNEAVCEYWVSITTEYPDIKTKTILEIMDEYVDQGIKLILNFVGKKTSDSIISLVSNGTTTDNFVDFRSLAKIKVLVKIPVDILAPLEDKEEKSKDEMPDSADFPLTVVITARDIRSDGSKFNIVKRAIGNKYSKQYEVGFRNHQLSGLPANILLKKEANRLNDFKKALIELLKKQGFKINPTLSNKKNGILEAVEIGFKEKYSGIKYIKANNMGCDVKELGNTTDDDLSDGGPGWDSFLKKPSVNYPTTLAFVANLPTIYDKITSDSPPAVDTFIKNYFYPPIESTMIGQDLTLASSFVDENGCRPEELVMNLSRIITTPGLEVIGTALSLPELISKTFTEKACLTLEGKQEQDKKINLEEEIEERAKDVDLRKFYSGDPIFENLPKTLREVTNMEDLFKEILNKLGVCGLSSLAFDGLGCLIKGFDIELSMSLLVKTFIRNATDKEMESIFFSFHPGLQQFIRNSVLAITAIPLPWEAGYRPGSYQAAGVKYSFDTYGSGDISGTGSAGSIESRINRAKELGSLITAQQNDPETEALQSFRARSKTSIKEQEEKFRSFTDIPLTEEDGKTPILDKKGKQIVITSPEGVMPAPGLGPRSYAGPFAHAGSVGTALDGIQDNAIDALKEAITDALEKNIVSADSMMSFIDKLPLGKLLKNTILDTLDCPLPPLFSPPLDDILKTLELDFCAGHYSVTLPVVPKLQVRPFLGDIWTILIEAAEEALEALVVRAITIILEKLLSFSINLSCEILKDTAGILNDIAGGSNFREIIAENLCGDSLNDSATAAAFNQLNEALGSLGLPGAPKPDNSDMAQFIDGISAILTQEELLDFLDGDPSTQAVSYARQIIKGIPNLLAVLKTDEDIKNMFVGLGKVFDRNKIRDRVAQTAFKPISPSICGSPEHLELFDEIRCGILKEKGLTEEECKNQLDKLKEQAKCDFNDLADVVNENFFGNPEIIGSPNCPDTGIYPGEDPHTKKLTQELFDSNYEVINATFMKELLTKKGLLNMILADSRGTGFKKHNEFWVQIFGSALSKDFGLLDFYADEKIGNPGSKALLDTFAFEGDPIGTYPTTVASYLQNILADDLDVKYSDSSISNILLKFDTTWDGAHPDKGDNGFPSSIGVDYNYIFNNDKIIYMKITSEDDQLGPPLEYKVIKSYDSDIIDKISSLGAQSPTTTIGKELYIRNQEYVFGKFMASAWSKATVNQSEQLESSYQTIEFPYITEKIIEKFARKISKNPRAFKFGYNAGAVATIVPLDHTKYGGSEANPAFYVEPPVHLGWLGLYDDLVPEVDGCSREPILNFNSISAQTSEYSDKLTDDPRMQIPAACAVDSERPFDRAMPRAALAGTDGAIMATVRLYVMETFLRGLPAFSMFDPKFPEIYDDVLLSYITSNIKRGLLDTGINFRTKDSKERYYYTFLEEVVQNFGKKVDLGLIIPTQSQINAMAKINEVQETWQKPKKKAVDVYYKKKVRDHMIYKIMAVENQCLVLLNYYVSQQITQVAQDFSNALGSSISSLESWFFGSQTWMSLGSLKTQAGPMDVSLDPLDDDDDVVELVKGMNSGANLTDEPYSSGYFPFILEKYIKVRPKQKTPSIQGVGLDPDIFQIYNFEELANILSSNDNLATAIEKNYGQWSYGLRISMVMSGETKGEIDDIASFYNSIPKDLVKRDRSYKFGSDTTGKLVVPVATAEILIPGTTLGAQATSGFDINCMIAELISTPEYKTLFNYCFPLQSLLSLVTIYTIETFLLSIGEEWNDKKGKPRPGGAKGSQFKTWDKESSFKKTRKNLRRLFEGFYNSRDATYQDPEMETQEERTRKKLKVKRKLPTDKQIKWWKKRLQVPKPAEACEEGDN